MNFGSLNSRLATGALVLVLGLALMIGGGYDDSQIKSPVLLWSSLAPYSVPMAGALLVLSVLTVFAGARNKRIMEQSMKQLEAQQLVTDLVNDLSVGIFQIRSFPDNSFVHEFANLAARRIAHISENDSKMSASQLFERIHPDDQARARSAVRDTLSTGKALREVLRFEFPSKIWGRIVVEASVRTNPDNSKTWMGFVADMSTEFEQNGPLQERVSDKSWIVDELAQIDVELQADPSPVWVKPAPGKNRLLFVDDDRVSRTTMTALLTAQGFDIDDVDSGAEALVKLQFSDYDAVLIDYRMPQMSGLELAAFIRDGYIGALLPPILIAITGGLSAQELENAEVAFDSIIVKPIKAKALGSTLTRILAET